MSSCLVQCLLLVLCLNIYGISSQWAPTSICDDLVPEFCSLPFPNDYWLLKDKNMSPLHLSFTSDNFPKAITPVHETSPYYFNQLDGFSPNTALLTYFKDISLSNSNCPRIWNISQSLDPDTPILLIEADTNKRIPIWVELDYASDDLIQNEKNHTLMVWPAQRLIDSKRYVIGIRNLKNTKNNLIQSSALFHDIKNNITSNNTNIQKRIDYFNAYIFPVLKKHNISRSELQIAWDYTVMSTKQLTNTMVTMRDDAFSRINYKDNGGVQYRISSVEQKPFDNIARKINGFMYVPWYLNSHIPGADVRIVKEVDNHLMPMYQRTEEVEFEILIPNSVSNNTKHPRWVQYGHGLFGKYTEIETSYLREEADERGYIVGAVDWLGMCKDDLPFVIETVTLNITNFVMVPDRLHQGMLNALFLMKLMLSPHFLSDDVFKNDYNVSIFNGVNISDIERNFYGNSLGGIMGSVYMSLTTDVTHGAIGVPGFPFSLILPRSRDFGGLFDIIKTRYPHDVDRILTIAGMELLYNMLEPGGYINHLNENMLINTPQHSVLIHYGLGDCEVTVFSAQQLGRTLHCYMYKSQVPEGNVTIFNPSELMIDDDVVIDTINDKNNSGACLMQGWNYNQPTVPFVNQAPPKKTNNDTHEHTRRQSDSQQAIWEFFSKGILYNPCNGSCNGTQTPPKQY